jgi:hypothetical protein
MTEQDKADITNLLKFSDIHLDVIRDVLTAELIRTKDDVAIANRLAGAASADLLPINSQQVFSDDLADLVDKRDVLTDALAWVNQMRVALATG